MYCSYHTTCKLMLQNLFKNVFQSYKGEGVYSIIPCVTFLLATYLWDIISTALEGDQLRLYFNTFIKYYTGLDNLATLLDDGQYPGFHCIMDCSHTCSPIIGLCCKKKRE